MAQVLWACANLTLDDNNRNWLRECGAINSLVHLLSHKSLAIVTEALVPLTNILNSGECVSGGWCVDGMSMV